MYIRFERSNQTSCMQQISCALFNLLRCMISSDIILAQPWDLPPRKQPKQTTIFWKRGAFYELCSCLLYTSYIIPMQCEYYSLEGLAQLYMSVNKIKKLYHPSLTLIGILITMYNGRLNLSVQVLEEVKKYYGPKLFSTPIARNVRLSEAPGFGMPCLLYTSRCV